MTLLEAGQLIKDAPSSLCRGRRTERPWRWPAASLMTPRAHPCTSSTQTAADSPKSPASTPHMTRPGGRSRAEGQRQRRRPFGASVFCNPDWSLHALLAMAARRGTRILGEMPEPPCAAAESCLPGLAEFEEPGDAMAGAGERQGG